MEKLTVISGIEVWDDEFRDLKNCHLPFAGKYFAVFLTARDISIAPLEQEKLLNKLVRENCRYIFCFGACARMLPAIQWATVPTNSSHLVMSAKAENCTLAQAI